MQMQMQVAVDMVERQAGGAELLKLRLDFGAKLVTQAALDKIAKTGGNGLVAELALRIDKTGPFSAGRRMGILTRGLSRA